MRTLTGYKIAVVLVFAVLNGVRMANRLSAAVSQSERVLGWVRSWNGRDVYRSFALRLPQIGNG